MKPSVLAVIPARANSKRIPGKNKKLFLGKPLIGWSIEAALNSACVSDVVVTTDDDSILTFAQNYPTVQFLKRPPELALDTTPGIDPVLHLMEHSKKTYDYVLLLQPTSPLRTSKHIEQAFQALLKSTKKQLVSVKKIVDSLGHVVFSSNDRVQFLKKTVFGIPDDKDLKVLNGAIYFSEWKTLLTEKNFIGQNVELFEMDELVSVDIDYPEDWDRAERNAKLNLN